MFLSYLPYNVFIVFSLRVKMIISRWYIHFILRGSKQNKSGYIEASLKIGQGLWQGLWLRSRGRKMAWIARQWDAQPKCTLHKSSDYCIKKSCLLLDQLMQFLSKWHAHAFVNRFTVCQVLPRSVGWLVGWTVGRSVGSLYPDALDMRLALFAGICSTHNWPTFTKRKSHVNFGFPFQIAALTFTHNFILTLI